MSTKKRFQIKHKQKLKRRKRRRVFKSEKLDPNDFFYSGYYVGPKK